MRDKILLTIQWINCPKSNAIRPGCPGSLCRKHCLIFKSQSLFGLTGKYYHATLTVTLRRNAIENGVGIVWEDGPVASASKEDEENN